MLTSSKKARLHTAIRNYKKKYLDRNLTELDESGTRLMINSFLSDVLGYQPIEEIKTEYMIKGTYADYVIQLQGTRHFLVEVKALSFELSEKHLRQAINYGANEGIEWALLTNGKQFDFYKIIFNKPIEYRNIFSLDLSEVSSFHETTDHLQFLHRESVSRKGLKLLWNRFEALFPENVAGMLYSREIQNTLRRLIKKKYGEKCDLEDIEAAIAKIVLEKLDPSLIKPYKSSPAKRVKKNIKEQKPRMNAETGVPDIDGATEKATTSLNEELVGE